MVMSTCRESTTLQTAKYVKKAVGFAICFLVAFLLSCYGMPLYSLTTWLVDHSHQLFSRYQADIYEPDSDPVTFLSLIIVVGVYALVFLLADKNRAQKVKTLTGYGTYHCSLRLRE